MGHCVLWGVLLSSDLAYISKCRSFGLLCRELKSFSNMEGASLQTEVLLGLIPMEVIKIQNSCPQFCIQYTGPNSHYSVYPWQQIDVSVQNSVSSIYVQGGYNCFHSIWEKILNSVWQS